MPRFRPLPSMIARPRPEVASAGARQGCGTRLLPSVNLDPHVHGVDCDPHDELGPGVQHRVRRELVRRHQQRVGQLAPVVVAQQVLQRLPQERACDTAGASGSNSRLTSQRSPPAPAPAAAPTRGQAAGLVVGSTR